MSSRKRIFAGPQLRRIRAVNSLPQAVLAERLGISASYLSQLEHDDRPLTARLAEQIAKLFPLDWQDVEADQTDQLSIALRDALADPIFDEPLSADMLARLAEQQPGFARQFVTLYEAYRHTSQRLEMVDEAVEIDDPLGARLPWEEVRDWFHLSNNHVDRLDRAAEILGLAIAGPHTSPSAEALRGHLAAHHDVRVDWAGGQWASGDVQASPALRSFDAGAGVLRLDAAQPAEGVRFQLAWQAAALSLGETIADIAGRADLRSDTARELLKVGLANYAAGALLMPYESFRRAARSMRHDIERLSLAFGTSFEQTCHRLSTLQREGARGLPVFFCRVDMAGNITKRHSATRLQFARFGGACPLWIVHEAAAIPDRILVQHAQTPDGARYVSMAKGLVKPSGRYDRAPRRYAVALGCEAQHAGEFIYADAVDAGSREAATKIGISCRICPRTDCDQRAFPPSDQKIAVDPLRRGVVPYHLQG